jgi:hypothetical protein
LLSHHIRSVGTISSFLRCVHTYIHIYV